MSIATNSSFVVVDGENFLGKFSQVYHSAIAQKHSIPYTVREIELESRSAVIQWMYSLQLGRRNLSEEEKSYYRAKQYELLKQERGGDRGNQYTKRTDLAVVASRSQASQGTPDDVSSTKKVARGHSDPLPKKTAQIVAEKTGVSEKTVKRDAKYAKAVDAIAFSLAESEIAQKLDCSPQKIINSSLMQFQGTFCAMETK